jgi:hypothetical protein
MTDNNSERQIHAEARNVTITRRPNGEHRGISVRTEFYTFEKNEYGEADNFEDGISATWYFDISGGTAKPVDFKIEEKPHISHSGDRVGLHMLRTLPAAADAVKGVPGVEAVVELDELLAEEIAHGYRAFTNGHEEP